MLSRLLSRVRGVGRLTRRATTLMCVVAVVCAACAAVGGARGEFAPPRAQANDTYIMALRLLPDEQALIADIEFTYTNRTGEALDRVVFNVYGNCFRRESALPYDADSLSRAFPAGFAPGGLTFYSVLVNGEAADWGMLGEDEIFMRVACALEPNETCVFTFGYILLLADNRAFLGWGERDWRLVYFYPSACVYEYGGFTLNPATDAGEFFYSDIADFRAVIYAPEGYDIACGGVVESATAERGWVRHSILLNDARDMSLIVSRKFHSYEGEAASGVRVRTYGSDRARSKRALAAAKSALDVYENWFGAYPYPDLTLALAGVYTDSMSLTGLILLGDEADEIEFTVYRAVASEYFGVLAQPNMALEAWLDEALSEYAALLLTWELKGERAYIDLLNSRVLPALQLTLPGGLSPDSYTARFTSEYEYRLITRLRGAAVLNELKRAMGRENIIRALGEYARANRFSIVSIADFAQALSVSTGRAWDEALLSWLNTIDDYANEILEYYD